MIRVLVVNVRSDGGGAETVLKNLINAVNAGNFGLHIDVLSKDKFDTKFLTSNKITGYIRFLFELRQRCGQYDFVVAGVEGVPFILCKFAVLGRKTSRLILWLHCTPSQYLKFQKLINRIAIWYSITYATNVICAAWTEAVRLKKMGKNSFYLPNIRQSVPHPISDGSSSVLPKLAFVGSLATLKQPLKTIEVLDRLIKDTGLEYKLDIYGDGPLFKEINLEIKKNKICNSVKMHGFVPNPWAKILPRSILLLPSLTEATPMVVLEAIEKGCVIISNNYNGSEYFGSHKGLFIAADYSDMDLVVRTINEALNWSAVELAERTLKSQLFVGEMFNTDNSINMLYSYLNSCVIDVK